MIDDVFVFPRGRVEPRFNQQAIRKGNKEGARIYASVCVCVVCGSLGVAALVHGTHHWVLRFVWLAPPERN